MVTGDSLMTACYVAKACGIMGRIDDGEVRVGTDITSTSVCTGTKDEGSGAGGDTGDITLEDDGVPSIDEKNDDEVVDNSNNREHRDSPQHVQSSRKEEHEEEEQEVLTLSLVDAPEASGIGRQKKHIVWTDLSGQVKYIYELSKNIDDADNGDSSKADVMTNDNDDNDNNDDDEDNEDASRIVGTHAHTVRSTSVTPPPQELRGYVGMSARDLAVIGGYNLAATGKVIRYLHEEASEGDEHCMGALSELVHFKVLYTSVL